MEIVEKIREAQRRTRLASAQQIGLIDELESLLHPADVGFFNHARTKQIIPELKRLINTTLSLWSHDMGTEASIINAAVSVINSQKATIASLQANQKDSADLAAEQSAESNPDIAAAIAAGTGAPTVAGGTGADTLTGAAGTGAAQ